MEVLRIVIVIFVPAVMCWVSWLIGRATGRLDERKKKVQPICPCSHVASAHMQGKRCLAEIQRPHYSESGARNGYEYVGCPCFEYQGPKVINDEFFHPGVIAS